MTISKIIQASGLGAFRFPLKEGEREIKLASRQYSSTGRNGINPRMFQTISLIQAVQLGGKRYMSIVSSAT